MLFDMISVLGVVKLICSKLIDFILPFHCQLNILSGYFLLLVFMR